MILVNGQCVSDGDGTDEATEQCQANNAALQQEVEQCVSDKGECATQLEQISDEKDQILLIKQQCLDDKKQTNETNEQLGTLLESCDGESTQNQEDLSKCTLAKERAETAENTCPEILEDMQEKKRFWRTAHGKCESELADEVLRRNVRLPRVN
jgi:chromosome segregation ATPase